MKGKANEVVLEVSEVNLGLLYWMNWKRCWMNWKRCSMNSAVVAGWNWMAWLEVAGRLERDGVPGRWHGLGPRVA